LLFVQINDFYHIDYLLDPADKQSMVLPRLATILAMVNIPPGANRLQIRIDINLPLDKESVVRESAAQVPIWQWQ